jgi:hypothetical protein
MINDRLPVSSPLEMSLWVEYGAHGDSGTAHLQIVAVEPIVFTSPRLRLAVVEDSCISGVKKYDQVLRDYLGGPLGYAITIAEGDTVLRDENFVLSAAWNENKCRILAFVQEGKTGAPNQREVLQAVQAPVVSHTPPSQVSDVTITLLQGDLVLEWSPVTMDTSGHPIVVDSYNIYRNTVAFFDPGSDPFDGVIYLSFTDTTGAVGDTLVQYYYAVTAVYLDEESDFSGIVGEFDTRLINEVPIP